MPKWKLNIFISAIKSRMEQECIAFEEILNNYTKLTSEEKEEILTTHQVEV